MSSTNYFSRRQLQILLLLGDAFLLSFALWLVTSLRFYWPDFLPIHRLFSDSNYWIILFIIFFSQYLFDLYEPINLRGNIASRLKLVLASLLSSGLAFAWLYLGANPSKDLFGRGIFIGSLIIYVSLTYIYRRVVYLQIRSVEKNNRWLLLASKKSAESFTHDFHESTTIGHLEWVDTESSEVTRKKLEQAVEQTWTGIIVEGSAAKNYMQILMSGKLKGLRLYSLPDFYELQWEKLPVSALDDSWFAFTEGFSLIHSHFQNRLKRALDITVATILLILTLPLTILTYALVKLTSRGPAIYKQKRVGWKNSEFTIYKFRSMHTDSEVGGAQWAQKNDARTTLIGKYLRKFRVDEIPQLLNILKGDMSFIGPRPERPEFTGELAKKIPFYDLRHMVKPGLTGWAQVMYPYGAGEEDARKKLEYELFYIKNHSIGLDMKIIFKTFSVVLFGAGR